MRKAEDLNDREIEAIVSEVEAAVLSGKTRRAPEIEVMRTRLAAMESIIANFDKDLNALAASQSPHRQPVWAQM
jgi:hypothetical protein